MGALLHGNLCKHQKTKRIGLLGQRYIRTGLLKTGKKYSGQMKVGLKCLVPHSNQLSEDDILLYQQTLDFPLIYGLLGSKQQLELITMNESSCFGLPERALLEKDPVSLKRVYHTPYSDNFCLATIFVYRNNLLIEHIF